MSESPSTLQVRVLTGPQADAAADVEAGSTVSIGSDLMNDVVLRDPNGKAQRVTLQLADDTAVLHVVEGEVTLLGQVVAPGQSAPLPQCVPFLLGSTLIAFGRVGAAAWATCANLAMPAPPAAAQTPPVNRRFWVRWASIGTLTVVCLVASFSLFASAGGYIASMFRPDARQGIRAIISRPPYNELALVDTADGGLAIKGELRTDAERVALAEQLQRAQLRPTLDILTGEQIVKAASDVFRVNGVETRVVYEGEGVLHVDGHGLSPERSDELARIAMHDVPGVKHLVYASLPAASGAAAAHVEHGPTTPVDPGKRVVSIVAGEGGYVLTADGAHYFPGAVLPSGHRITAIDAEGVLVEKDGATTRLVF